MACPENVCENCGFAERGSGEMECSCPVFVYADHEPPEDGLVYYDYEECGAWFRVGPKFGCVHWKPRE